MHKIAKELTKQKYLLPIKDWAVGGITENI